MKISPRLSDLVRIVFSVPLLLSEATMSPATSAVISGRPQIDMKKRTTNGVASPVSRMLRPRRMSFGPPDWVSSTTTKTIGTSIATPRPRYVRFWASSLASSQR